MSCKASTTHSIDNLAKLLKSFLDWLLSGRRQRDMPGGGRTFRRRASRLWTIWPMPPVVDEICRVVFVDGIYLARNIVVLIARGEKHVLSWYLARSENSNAWAALMLKIAPPDVVVTDGGSGFEKARRAVWPKTKVQRCIFHAFCQVKRQTTTRPNLPAGVELYALAKELLKIKTLKQASVWVEGYNAWCTKWAEFLAETTITDGKKSYTHERLVTARNGLTGLINKGTLFTFLDLDLMRDGPLPATNNAIEGGVNSPLRDMLRRHRGMSITRRIKAVFWWCYMHTEHPLTSAGIIKTMPTDESIDKLYRDYASASNRPDGPVELGDAVVWHELHKADAFRSDWD